MASNPYANVDLLGALANYYNIIGTKQGIESNKSIMAKVAADDAESKAMRQKIGKIKTDQAMIEQQGAAAREGMNKFSNNYASAKAMELPVSPEQPATSRIDTATVDNRAGGKSSDIAMQAFEKGKKDYDNRLATYQKAATESGISYSQNPEAQAFHKEMMTKYQGEESSKTTNDIVSQLEANEETKPVAQLIRLFTSNPEAAKALQSIMSEQGKQKEAKISSERDFEEQKKLKGIDFENQKTMAEITTGNKKEVEGYKTDLKKTAIDVEGLTPEEKKDAYRLKADISKDEEIKGIDKAIGAAKQLYSLISSTGEGETLASSVVKTQMPRLMGEVGNLAQQEQTAWVGAQDYLSRLERYVSTSTTSKMTSGDKAAMLDVISTLESTMMERAIEKVNIHKSMSQGISGIDDEKYDKIISPILSRYSVTSNKTTKPTSGVSLSITDDDIINQVLGGSK